MISFGSDYLEGAHESIIKRLCETNMLQTGGYGEDEICDAARKKITDACAQPQAQVHFLVGGTQTNLTVISSILKPYQGAICATSGHINTHETGAIEATGHKVLPLVSTDGKVSAAQVQEYVDAHYNDVTHEHIVQPGMVYISQPTEIGTLYTKAELTALSETCRRCGIALYIDGARMAYGLTSSANDLSLPDIASLCDIFYIGGTKCGALMGEAVVIVNPALQKDFRYIIKQRGGRFAKGRLLGIQFDCLFTDGLYYELGKHANVLAERIKNACLQKGYPMLGESFTNQQFPIMPDDAIAALEKKYEFSYWQRVDATHSAVRFCTSWATKAENVDMLIKDILG